jgi:hypothetical protein
LFVGRLRGLGLGGGGVSIAWVVVIEFRMGNKIDRDDTRRRNYA